MQELRLLWIPKEIDGTQVLKPLGPGQFRVEPQSSWFFGNSYDFLAYRNSPNYDDFVDKDGKLTFVVERGQVVNGVDEGDFIQQWVPLTKCPVCKKEKPASNKSTCQKCKQFLCFCTCKSTPRPSTCNLPTTTTRRFVNPARTLHVHPAVIMATSQPVAALSTRPHEAAGAGCARGEHQASKAKICTVKLRITAVTGMELDVETEVHECDHCRKLVNANGKAFLPNEVTQIKERWPSIFSWLGG
jgi:hypothetical protein